MSGRNETEPVPSPAAGVAPGGGAGVAGDAAALVRLLEATDLTPMQRAHLEARWRDQVRWYSRRAATCRRRHFLLRVPAVVGSLLVPTLVTVALGSSDGGASLTAPLFVVSFTVAVCTALEELFHYGELWRSYRRTSEALKSLGWRFLALNGPFGGQGSHRAAFTAFADAVERTVGEEVESYVERAGTRTQPKRPDVL